MKVILEHLTKRFPNRDKKKGGFVTAVSDVNLEIPDGKLIGLLGPSGCGKSTILNMVCGLEEPTEGNIYFGEENVTKIPPEKRGVGMVFQNYALYPHLTVRQNIIFPLENLKGDAKLSKEEMNAKALEVAKLVQIEDYMERKPNELSGGQQQRVAIARSLVKMPRLLLLDEPLSNLDARLRLQTREEIKRIQVKTGITTIFVTHDQEEAMSITDVMIVMKDGVIHQVGKPQEIYDNPINLFVAKFLGTPAINVFDGKVVDGKLYIGSDCIKEVNGISNQDVYVGIRPEGFIVSEDGVLNCRLKGVEVMGRDSNIVFKNPQHDGYCRAVVQLDNTDFASKKDIKFNLKDKKVLLFAKDSEERLYEK